MEDGNTTAKAVGKKRRLLLAGGSVIAAVILAVVFWPGPKEPEYQGKKLGEWGARHDGPPAETATAVRAIGTNALPLLLKWIDFSPPAWQWRLAQRSSADIGGKLGCWLVEKNF